MLWMQEVWTHKTWIPNKEKEEKKKDSKGKQVLQACIDSDNEDNEDSLSEFCFTAMENGEEVEENNELQ